MSKDFCQFFGNNFIVFGKQPVCDGRFTVEFEQVGPTNSYDLPFFHNNSEMPYGPHDTRPGLDNLQ